VSPLHAVVEAVDHPALDPHKSLGLVTGAGQIARWIAAGADLNEDIIPTIRAVMARKDGYDRISSWGYFTRAVMQSLGRKRGQAVAMNFAAALKLKIDPVQDRNDMLRKRW
jgi:hypothetical protein